VRENDRLDLAATDCAEQCLQMRGVVRTGVDDGEAVPAKK
jgi:hypothetical protein